MIVAVAVQPFHRDDFGAKLPFAQRRQGTLMAFVRVGVEFRARQAVFFGDPLSRDALVDEFVFFMQRRRNRPFVSIA